MPSRRDRDARGVPVARIRHRDDLNDYDQDQELDDVGRIETETKWRRAFDEAFMDNAGEDDEDGLWAQVESSDTFISTAQECNGQAKLDRRAN